MSGLVGLRWCWHRLVWRAHGVVGVRGGDSDPYARLQYQPGLVLTTTYRNEFQLILKLSALYYYAKGTDRPRGRGGARHPPRGAPATHPARTTRGLPTTSYLDRRAGLFSSATLGLCPAGTIQAATGNHLLSCGEETWE